MLPPSSVGQAIRVWMRVIRVRFVMASVIAASVGISMAWWQTGGLLDVVHAALTVAGVLALHASVDLLNDYWDHKRGIDTVTRRTKMSGGTGVLPEGLLSPSSVYRAGVGFLVAGAGVGCYFVVTHGWVVAVLLGFAVVSIYFYSTRIVDSGMAEVFVGIKGAMVVVGAFFIQGGELGAGAWLAGAAVGALSSGVLLAASLPDRDADKAGGRRTLAVVAGRRRAASCFWAFPAVACCAVGAGAAVGVLPPASLIMAGALPIAVWAGVGLRRHCDDVGLLVPYMAGTMYFGRAAGVLLAAGFVLAGIAAGL